MDLDKGLVSSILREGFRAFERAQPVAGLLTGDGAKAFEWLAGFAALYRRLPALETVEAATGVPLDMVSEPAEFS